VAVRRSQPENTRLAKAAVRTIFEIFIGVFIALPFNLINTSSILTAFDAVGFVNRRQLRFHQNAAPCQDIGAQLHAAHPTNGTTFPFIDIGK